MLGASNNAENAIHLLRKRRRASRQEDDPMPKQRTILEQQEYEARMKRLKQSLEQDALRQEEIPIRSDEEKDCRLSNLDLNILKSIIQLEP
jgi:hypothetical protein